MPVALPACSVGRWEPWPYGKGKEEKVWAGEVSSARHQLASPPGMRAGFNIFLGKPPISAGPEHSWYIIHFRHSF